MVDILPGHGMEWNENFDMEYKRCQNGMEWKISIMERKTILHTYLRIPYYNLCMVFTEKYIRIVIDIILTEVFNIYSTICRQIAVLQLCVLRKQCIRIASYTAICSINAIADGFNRFDLFFDFEITNLPSRKFFHRHGN